MGPWRGAKQAVREAAARLAPGARVVGVERALDAGPFDPARAEELFP